MAETWVVNASPLITLAKVGRLDLLFAVGRTVLVPTPVSDEIQRGPADDPARKALLGELGLETRSVAVDHDVIEWGLGAGESAVLSLTRASGALAILDDREARSAARTLGIRCSGTLGVVLHAARTGRIAAAAPVIRALCAAGLRLSDSAVADALLRFLGEKWEP